MALGEKNQTFFGRNRWLTAALGIVVAVVLLGSFVTRRDDSVPVRAAFVERGTIRSVVSTNGRVEPLQNVEAHAPVPATVKRVLVKEGDQVKKGQLLLQLDDADARTRVDLDDQLARLGAAVAGGQEAEPRRVLEDDAHLGLRDR